MRFISILGFYQSNLFCIIILWLGLYSIRLEIYYNKIFRKNIYHNTGLTLQNFFAILFYYYQDNSSSAKTLEDHEFFFPNS